MNCELCTHTSDKKYQMSTASEEKLPNLVKAKIDEGTMPNTNALGQRIWKTKTIYWKRESSYPWIDDETIDKMIKAAFLESSMHTPLIIQQRNRKMSDAHIVINWLGKKDEPYFTSQSTLAFGYGPGSGIGGNVTMNADVLWLLRKTPLLAKEAKELGYIENYADPSNVIKYYDPLHTMKHEAGGHALGMNHVTDLNQKLTAIMYPYYNGLRKFGKADIDYIISLYGKASVSDVIKNTIRFKILGF
jgi:hypothetical protein